MEETRGNVTLFIKGNCYICRRLIECWLYVFSPQRPKKQFQCFKFSYLLLYFTCTHNIQLFYSSWMPSGFPNGQVVIHNAFQHPGLNDNRIDPTVKDVVCPVVKVVSCFFLGTTVSTTIQILYLPRHK